MIDIHCHILPEVDDGAKSWEVAVTMCAIAWQDGIEHIVATPHANEEYFYDRKYLEDLLQKLQGETGGKPALSLGCDFHFSFENVQDAFANPSRYTIGNTPYLLVEFNDYSLPPAIDDSLSELLNFGLKPIITHPERNPMLQRTPERVLDWVRGGCAVQITANTLTGRWGRRADSTARWLFDREAVHIVASDAHGLTSRPPILSEARTLVQHMCGENVADALFTQNPRAVIQGKPLPYFPVPRLSADHY
jgi:protein-tyrosine phosphatase